MSEFLPDIQRSQRKLGFIYKVHPFNYNAEHFNTVEIRRRPANSGRTYPDRKVAMRSGHKAANEIEPRPLWSIKHLSFVESDAATPCDEYNVYTRLCWWHVRDSGRKTGNNRASFKFNNLNNSSFSRTQLAKNSLAFDK